MPLDLELLEDDSPVGLDLELIPEPQGMGDLKVAEQRIANRNRIILEGEERMQLPNRSGAQDNPIYNELSQLNYGVTKGLANLGSAVNQAGAIAADIALPAFPQLSQTLQERALLARKGGQLIEQEASAQSDIGGGSDISRALGEGAVSILPAITPWGVTGGAIAGGLQSGLSTLTDAQEAYEQQGKANPRLRATIPALGSGLITAAVTAAGGKTGPEALSSLIQSGTWKQLGKTILNQSGIEASEEMVDQLGQGILQKSTYEPNKPLEQIAEEMIQAGFVGGVLGGGMATLGGADLAQQQIAPLLERAKSILPQATKAVEQTQAQSLPEPPPAAPVQPPPSTDTTPAQQALNEINAELAQTASPDLSLEPVGETSPIAPASPTTPPVGPVPSPGEPAPTLEQDIARYQSIQSELAPLIASGDLENPRIQQLWAENETIKNRHGGMPPGTTPSPTLEPDAAIAQVKSELGTEPEIPIGLSRPDKPDPALRVLSDTEFDAEFKEAKKLVNQLEKELIDDNPNDIDSLTPQQRQKLADTQDRWSSAELERLRRNYQDTHPGDVFFQIRQLGNTNPEKVKILLEILMQQGATEAEMLEGLQLKTPDQVESFRGQMEDIKAIASTMEPVASRTPKANAVPAERKALPPPHGGMPPGQPVSEIGAATDEQIDAAIAQAQSESEPTVKQSLQVEPAPVVAPVPPAAKAVRKPRVRKPVQAIQQAEEHIETVVEDLGKRPAAEVKTELVQRIQDAIKVAPTEFDKKTQALDVPDKVKINIPGDGNFTVINTKENLEEVLKNAKGISLNTPSRPKAPVPRVDTTNQGRKKRIEYDADSAIKLYSGVKGAIQTIKQQVATTEENGDDASRSKELLNELWRKAGLPREELQKEIRFLKEQIKKSTDVLSRKKLHTVDKRQAEESLMRGNAKLKTLESQLKEAEAEYRSIEEESQEQSTVDTSAVAEPPPISPAEDKLAQVVNESIEALNSNVGISPFKSSRPADIVLGAADLQSLSPKVEQRWKAAVKAKPSILSKAKETAQSAYHSITREYAGLNPRDYAREIDELRKLRASRNANARQTVDILRGITHNLGPKQYDVFTRVLALDDLLKDVDSGKYAAGQDLPFGYKDRTELEADLSKFRSISEATPQIKAAIKRRQDFMDSLRQTLVDRGILPDTVLNDPRYFHHQVLLYLDAAKAPANSKSFRDWFSGWTKTRTGSSLDYNRQYVEAEAEVIADSLNKISLQNSQANMEAIADITPSLKATHGADWEKNIPKTHTKWQPKRGSVFYPVNTVAEKAMDEYLNGIRDLLPEDFKEALAVGQKRKEWIVPRELAQVLDNLTPAPDKWIDRLASAGIGGWKRYILLNPIRAIKYQLNNTSGDLDFLFAANPKIFGEFKNAARDMYGFHKQKKAATGDIKDAMQRGVVGSGWRASELPNIGSSEFFHWLTGDKPGIVDRYWNWIGSWNDAREDTGRLASYRFALNQWNAGKPFYGASVPADVDAIADNKDKAAKVAREILIDYGRETEFGEYMRRKVIPFYRWMHGNFARYIQLVRNIPLQEGNAGARLAKLTAKRAGVKAAGLTARMAFLYMAVNLWNHLMFPEEEDELGEMRNQLHLILGRDDEGNIQTLRFQGALSDILSWVGLDDAPQDIKDVTEGKASVGDKMTEAYEAGISKLVNATSPFYKTGVEAATGQSLFPNVFEPRPIRDRKEHIAGLFSLQMPYRWIAEKPHKPLRRELASLLAYNTDPGEAAYNTTRQMAAEWLEEHGKERGAFLPSKRSNALYYYKQSLRYGNKELADKFLKEYMDQGGKQEGIRQSIQKSAPLSMLGKEKSAFTKSLSPAEKEMVKRAEEWHRKVYQSN